MRRASLIEKESVQINTVQDLTGVFESIASTQVAKVKNKVQLSSNFFELLWSRYKSIRMDPETQIVNRIDVKEGNKTAYIIISAEAGLSGDIDQRLIETMLQDYDEKTTDIIVLGSHGANMLTQRGIKFVRYFQVPESDKYIDVSPVIDAILPYTKVVVYYEDYVSLGVQDIKSIDLMSSMRDMSKDIETEEEVMTAEDTIFEPSLDYIADQMEMTMMTLTMSQTILDSSLAQAASRFSAMAVAKKRANELLGAYRLEFNHAKRAESDRRMREVLVGLKNKRKRLGAVR